MKLIVYSWMNEREWNIDNIVWIVRISCSLIENHCLLHFINWSIPLDDLNDNHHYHNQSDDNTNDEEWCNNPYSTINTQVHLYTVMQLSWVEHKLSRINEIITNWWYRGWESKIWLWMMRYVRIEMIPAVWISGMK